MITPETIASQFRFTIPIQMRWNDMDALGHVNNIYYFEYFQIARGEYMTAASKQWDWYKYMFVIGHIECDFMKELTLKHKNPMIHTRVSSFSNKSFVMEYVITSTGKEGEMIVHAKGHSVNVMIDLAIKKATEVPQWLVEELKEYEPAL